MITRISYKKNDNDGLYYSNIMVSYKGLIYVVLNKKKAEYKIHKVEGTIDTLLEQGECQSLDEVSLVVRHTLAKMGVLFYDGMRR